MLKICGAALLFVAASASVRELNKSVSSFFAAGFGLIAFAYILDCAAPIMTFVENLSAYGGDSVFTLLKALGVAICCQITADICRDCGESTAASRVELAGKIAIMLLSLPLIKDIVEIAGELSM